jgi:tetratricopeptide (TPR) repeat protein
VARLRSLLVRTGFDVEALICDHVPFIALLARASAPEVREAFAAAHAAAARGQLVEAEQALKAARGRQSSAVELEVLLAESELCLARGDGDGAAAACFRAQELAPNDARSFIGLSRIALAGGGASDALKLALEALRHDATEPAAYAVAGVAADALGHPDVFTAWRAAVNLAPDDAAVVGELARIASERGDHALALTSFERLERYGAPLSAEHHLARGFSLLAVGRRSEAEIEAHLALSKGAADADLEALKRAIASR